MTRLILAILLIAWLTALSAATYLNNAMLHNRIEVSAWVCAKTDRQRVLIIDPVSGATQALMDTCIEWRPK